MSGLCVAVLSKTFNPEKYADLLALLASTYASSGSPLQVLSCYLAVLTKETYASSLGEFAMAKYEDRRAMLTGPLKAFLAAFGMEAILILTAMLLKRRVVLFAQKNETLLQYARVLPMLVAHRQNWNVLRPLFQFTEAELADVKAMTHYVVATSDEAAESHEDIYDLFIDSTVTCLCFAFCGLIFYMQWMITR